MTASVGFSIFGSSRVSTRMSRGAWSTAPRMVIPFASIFRVVSGFLRLEPRGPRSGPPRDAVPYPGVAANASAGRVECARRTGSSKRDHGGDQQADLQPAMERVPVGEKRAEHRDR